MMTEQLKNYTITPEQASCPHYVKALQQEIECGKDFSETELKVLRINHPEILKYKAKVLGNKDTYENFADWVDFLIADYGYQERCLSLGSGIGRVEKYLVSKGFTHQMETIELCANENEKIRLKDEKINTVKGDLNFVELPPDYYDFILCHGVLHHLINLEYVLDQINKSLKPNGIFLVYEYIGETRWQFNESRLNYLRKNFPDISIKQQPVWRYRGFESVRSGDLFGILQQQFGKSCKHSVCYGGVYFPFVTTTPPKADAQMARVITLDADVTRTGELSPCYHMGIYRKNDVPAIPAKKWSDEMLKSQLSPPIPYWNQLVRLLRESPLGSSLIKIKRQLNRYF